MTVGVDDELRIREYPGDDTATPRAYGFKILDPDDLRVTRTNADGSETALVRGTHFTVSGAGNPAGGDVTPLAPIAAGTSWRIEGDMSLGQPTDYTAGDDFPAESHERGLDRSMIAHQEARRDINDTRSRAALMPRGETADPIPAAADRANTFDAWDPIGRRTQSAGTGADLGLRSDLGATGVGKGAGLLLHKQAGAGAIERLVSDILSDGSVSVKDWGAKGDGVTNDYAAIVLARTVALATDKALLFPEGDYVHGSTLEFGFSHLRVFCRGRVTLRHTGAGKAISFDAGPTPNIDGENEIHFGWDCPPTLVGNADTTDLVYIRGCHHMKFDARLRDCTTGLRIEFSVLSHFRVNGSINEGPFPDQQPTNWLVVDKRGAPEATTACKFECIIEGSTSYGIDLISAQSCEFWGTSEGNEGGGVKIHADSIKNNFRTFFCEQNGTGKHWDIAGSYNNFFNCSGGGPSNTGDNSTVIAGIRNQFFGGYFYSVSEIGYFNSWDQVSLGGAYDPSGLSIRTKCHDGAGNELHDHYPKPDIIAPAFVGLWVNVGSDGLRNVGYWRDSYGYVHLVGAAKSGAAASVIFNLPAGYRPGGTIWKKVYNPLAGADVVIAITSGGGLQHISGDQGAVILDGISFLAEG